MKSYRSSTIPPQPSYSSRPPLIIGVIIITLFIICISGAYYLGTKQMNKPSIPVFKPTFIPIPTVTPLSIPSPMESNKKIQTLTISNKTAGWKTYTDDYYFFKYPSDWFVDVALAGEQVVKLLNHNRTVTMGIYTRQPIYGRITPPITTDLTIVIEGKTYSTQEFDRSFVDLKIKKDKEYHILFGTGYPAGADNRRSLPDYNAARDTILTVLSTFKFLDQPPINQEKLTTYITCGCGCCGGSTPNKKCLYHSKGDDLDKIIQEDTKTKQSPQCSTMGCSIGIEYSYCD